MGKLSGFSEEHGLMTLVILELVVLALLGRRGRGRSEGGE